MGNKHWKLRTGTGVGHTWNGTSLIIDTSVGTIVTVAEADIETFLGEVLSTADDRATGRLPKTPFRRKLDATEWSEDLAGVTMSYPSSSGGVAITSGGKSFSTGNVLAYVNSVLSLCSISVGSFQ